MSNFKINLIIILLIPILIITGFTAKSYAIAYNDIADSEYGIAGPAVVTAILMANGYNAFNSNIEQVNNLSNDLYNNAPTNIKNAIDVSATNTRSTSLNILNNKLNNPDIKDTRIMEALISPLAFNYYKNICINDLVTESMNANYEYQISSSSNYGNFNLLVPQDLTIPTGIANLYNASPNNSMLIFDGTNWLIGLPVSGGFHISESSSWQQNKVQLSFDNNVAGNSWKIYGPTADIDTYPLSTYGNVTIVMIDKYISNIPSNYIYRTHLSIPVTGVYVYSPYTASFTTSDALPIIDSAPTSQTYSFPYSADLEYSASGTKAITNDATSDTSISLPFLDTNNDGVVSNQDILNANTKLNEIIFNQGLVLKTQGEEISNVYELLRNPASTWDTPSITYPAIPIDTPLNYLNAISSAVTTIITAISTPFNWIPKAPPEIPAGIAGFFPNILALLIAIMGFIAKAIIFIGQLSSIQPSTSMLNSTMIQGLEWARGFHTDGGVNLYSLVTGVITVMYGLFIFKLLRKIVTGIGETSTADYKVVDNQLVKFFK